MDDDAKSSRDFGAERLAEIEQQKTFGAARSAKWEGVRAEWIKDHGSCAACGSTKDLQVHHVVAFHTHPELELDPSNFITLCEGMERNCHRFIGHLDNFQSLNENSRADAEAWIGRIVARPSWKDGKWAYPDAKETTK